MNQSFNKATDEEKVEVQRIIEQINNVLNDFVKSTEPEDGSNRNKFAPWLGFSDFCTTLKIKQYSTYFRNYYQKFGWTLNLEPNINKYDFMLVSQAPPIISIPKTLKKKPEEPYHSYHTKIRSKYSSEFVKILQIFKSIQMNRINNTWPIIEYYEKINLLEKLLENNDYSINFDLYQNLDYDYREESMYIFAQWLAEEFKKYGWRLEAKIPGPKAMHKENLFEFKAFPIRDETQLEKYFKFGPILSWPDYHKRLIDETYFHHILKRHTNDVYYLYVPKSLVNRLRQAFKKLNQKVKFKEFTDELVTMLVD
ncbi:MAG: hypothetical protein WCP93_03885 [Candidatus Berkelbacteria bacterium]